MANLLGFSKEVEEDAGEVVCMVVGEAQLVGQGIQEQVAALCVQLHSNLLEDVHCRPMHHRLLHATLPRQDVQRLHHRRMYGKSHRVYIL